jgi:hypothetical protein
MTQIQRALRRFYLLIFVVLCLLLVQFWPYIEAPEPSCSSLRCALVACLRGDLSVAGDADWLVAGNARSPPRRSHSTLEAGAGLWGCLLARPDCRVAGVYRSTTLQALRVPHQRFRVESGDHRQGGLLRWERARKRSLLSSSWSLSQHLLLAVLLLLLHRVAAKSPAEPGRPVPRMAGKPGRASIPDLAGDRRGSMPSALTPARSRICRRRQCCRFT